jgi:hypothetical protein
LILGNGGRNVNVSLVVCASYAMIVHRQALPDQAAW